MSTCLLRSSTQRRCRLIKFSFSRFSDFGSHHVATRVERVPKVCV